MFDFCVEFWSCPLDNWSTFQCNVMQVQKSPLFTKNYLQKNSYSSTTAKFLPYFTFYLCYVSSKFAKERLCYHIMQKSCKTCSKKELTLPSFLVQSCFTKKWKKCGQALCLTLCHLLNDLVMYWSNTNISIKKWKKLT